MFADYHVHTCYSDDVLRAMSTLIWTLRAVDANVGLYRSFGGRLFSINAYDPTLELYALISVLFPAILY